MKLICSNIARFFPQILISLDSKIYSLKRYRGPGAGAEVTAGGVFSDLLRLAAYLGAPS